MKDQTTIINQFQQQRNDLYHLFFNKIYKSLEDKNQFITISSLEKFYTELVDQIHILDAVNISEILSNIDEKDIIKAFKLEYASKGILLRTNRKSSITIQTIKNKITIKRSFLAPKTKNDAEKLFNDEGVKGIYPVDRLMGIDVLPFRMTVDTMLKVSKKAQKASSFESAAEDLQEDCDIKLDPVTIASVTNHIGDIAYKAECEKAFAIDKLLKEGKLTFSSKKIDGILFIETDGSMVNTREINKITKSSWHENKLGMVYSSDHVSIAGKMCINGKERTRYKIDSKEYTSCMGGVDDFRKLLFACALNNGYGSYTETILVSDGAAWIRKLKEELFPDAQQILDYYHLSEKIWTFSKLYFNNNKELYSIWANTMCDYAFDSKYSQLLDDVLEKEYNKQIVKDKLSTYIENNISNIDYALYRTKGYAIGSGSIEGANKNVIQARLKLSGMRWNLESAQNLSTLRAKAKSTKWFEDVEIPVKKKYQLF
jgi:hypothetical protein